MFGRRNPAPAIPRPRPSQPVAPPIYKSLRQFNRVPPTCAGARSTLDERSLGHFTGDTLIDRLARALARERALPVKELFESCEFFERVRRRVRGPLVADLCAGHGLTGVLFALFERRVERVVLVDRRRPPSFDRVLRAAQSVGPWVADKVVYREQRLRDAADSLEPGTSVVAVHACGLRTDIAIDVALALTSAVGVMPCCYPAARCTAPPTLVDRLGAPLAFDIDRTYRLERAGYRIRWDAIPEDITPMGRVLVAWPAPNGKDVEPSAG